MDKTGQWSLSPAYDINYSYNPRGDWTSSHQMSINGKRDHYNREDFYSFAKRFCLGTRPSVNAILERVDQAINQWPDFAKQAYLNTKIIKAIAKDHQRLSDL